MEDGGHPRMVFKGILLGILVVVPVPEPILAMHGSIERVLGVGLVVPYLLALGVSLGLMRLEYQLMEEFDKKIMPVFERWRNRSRVFLNSDLQLLEYMLLVACSVNLVPVPPLNRTAGVLLWREWKIAAGGWVLAAGTAVRLCMLYVLALKLLG